MSTVKRSCAVPYRVEVDGLPVSVVRKPIRNLYLRVRDDGVTVSAPLRTSDERVREVVRARWGWIETHRERLAERRRERAVVAARGQVLLWGRPVPVERGGAGRWRVELREEALVVTAPATATPRARQAGVQRWLRTEMAAEVDRLIGLWQARMGVGPAGFRLRAMTSRWGSCNPRSRQLTFNTDLVHLDPALLEYVVVHELAHLIESGHGPAFQAVMDANLPGWRVRRRTLNRG
jgi:predicted metal-dependent hydrolase